jgi:hypothetical protein
MFHLKQFFPLELRAGRSVVGLPELTALELNTYCSPHFFLRAVRGVMFLLRLG